MLKTQRVIKITMKAPSSEIPSDKVRVGRISETHSLALHIKFDVPEGDIFIHVGDFTKCGRKEEVIEFNTWIAVANMSTELEAGDTQNSPDGALKPSTTLEVSSIGMSSFNSGIALDKLNVIYTSLRQVQRSLVLIDYFHLLYLVTPSDDNSYHTQPDPSIFYSKITSLTENQLLAANEIGITEPVAFKLMSGRPLKPEMEADVRHFYVTMLLNERSHLKPVSDVANAFKLDRGLVQRLMGMAAIENCHARQLYSAGYRKVDDIARAKSRELAASSEHLTVRVANQLISVAKVLVFERMENLRGELQECLDVYKS